MTPNIDEIGSLAILDQHLVISQKQHTTGTSATSLFTFCSNYILIL